MQGYSAILSCRHLPKLSLMKLYYQTWGSSSGMKMKGLSLAQSKGLPLKTPSSVALVAQMAGHSSNTSVYCRQGSERICPGINHSSSEKLLKPKISRILSLRLSICKLLKDPNIFSHCHFCWRSLFENQP